MIDRYPHSDKSIPVFIADRGFHAFNVFAHAIERKSYFLIRAKDVNVHRLLGKDFPSEDSFDLRVERMLTRSQLSLIHI